MAQKLWQVNIVYVAGTHPAQTNMRTIDRVVGFLVIGEGRVLSLELANGSKHYVPFRHVVEITTKQSEG
ncbi:MAG: hypothetical protein RLZZ324_530 [Candidatus Parcubacteria bacterium]|jgi:hypothetical protein